MLSTKTLCCLVAAALAVASSAIAPSAFAADNGLGQKPVMGWNSWKTWGKSYSATIVEQQANAICAQLSGQPSGTTLKSLGYTTMAMDSGWRVESGSESAQVDGSGFAINDTTKFPNAADGTNGILVVANYVHSLGLKLGIYLTPGILKAGYDGNYPIANAPINPTTGKPYTTNEIELLVNGQLTNGNTENSSGASYSYALDFTNPGAVQWIQNYADHLASWGIDYVMWDFVGPGGGNIPADDRANMQQWLIATQATPAGSRPIWIKLSNSLSVTYASTWQMVANSWRIDGDVGGSWTDVTNRMSDSPQWVKYEGTTSNGGGWGDMDSLLVGDANNYASTDERRSAVTLWAITCSPLILGQNLVQGTASGDLNSGDIPLISNPEVIAVDQAGAPAGSAAATPSGDTAGVWRVKNANGSYTVAIFNTTGSTETSGITCSFSGDLGFSGSATVRDLWARAALGTFTGSFNTGSLNSHACRLLTITPTTVPPVVATPTFSPGAGSYTSAQSVTISDTTSGASIRYTTDGSTPTESNGTLYVSGSPVNIATSTTLQAIGYESGDTDSDVASAVYTIGGSGSPVTFDASNLSYTGSGATPSLQTDTHYSNPDTWVELPATAPGQSITFATGSLAAGTYELQMEWKGNNTRGELSASVDGTTLSPSPLDQYSSGQTYPTTTFTPNLTFSTTGTHTIVLTVTGKNGSSSGYGLSAYSFIFTPQRGEQQVATPTFSPVGGTYTSAQSVTISDATSGATIRYTTDGSTPSEMNGTVYTAGKPVGISSTTTLQAIAYESGMSDSGVANATYTINGSGTTVAFAASNLSYTGSGATPNLQTDTHYSNPDTWVELPATATGQSITFTTGTVTAGTYQLQMEWKGNNTRGQLSASVDGGAALTPDPLDQYSSGQTYPTTTFSPNLTFGSTGTHTIKLTVTGKNASSSGYGLSAYSFILTPE